MVTVAHIGLLLISFVLTLLRASPRALFMVAALVLVLTGLAIAALPDSLPDPSQPGPRLTHDPYFVDFLGWEVIRLGIVATVLALTLEGLHRLDLSERRWGHLLSYWLLIGALCVPTLLESLIGLPRRFSDTGRGLELMQVVWRGGEIAGLLGISLFALLAVLSVVELISRKDV